MDVLSLALEDTQLRRASYHEQAGPCPSCGGNDRFRVKQDHEGNWSFMCRGCYDPSDQMPDGNKRGFGDAIDYLRHYRKMSFKDAKAMVEGDGTEVSVKAPTNEQRGYQSASWQSNTKAAMEQYVAALWSDAGAVALAYARGRGMKDETIKQFRFGYSEQGGIPRLLIPSVNDGRYVAIYRRDLRANIASDERWKDVPGGTKSELYLADLLKTRKYLPVVLTEDAFSALSIWQEAGDIVNVVATGSANCGKQIHWLTRLAQSPTVLIAFDNDEAGEKEAQWWLDGLENSRRFYPLEKDPNDMLQGHYDIRSWIQTALGIDKQSVFKAHINTLEADIAAINDDIWLCAECGVNLYREGLEPYYDEASGLPYCQLHGPLGTAENKEQFIARVNPLVSAIAKIVGGLQKPMEVYSRGSYSLDMHVKRLEEEARAQERQDYAAKKYKNAA